MSASVRTLHRFSPEKHIYRFSERYVLGSTSHRDGYPPGRTYYRVRYYRCGGYCAPEEDWWSTNKEAALHYMYVKASELWGNTLKDISRWYKPKREEE